MKPYSHIFGAEPYARYSGVFNTWSACPEFWPDFWLDFGLDFGPDFWPGFVGSGNTVYSSTGSENTVYSSARPENTVCSSSGTEKYSFTVQEKSMY